MERKFRSDATVDTIEKKLGLHGIFRNDNGRKTRKDKKLLTIRKESAKKSK